MRIGVIQGCAGNDKEKNIASAVALVEKAISRRAEFIILPEVFHFRGTIKSLAGLSTVAEKIPGPSILPLMALAKKHKVFILAGSIYEKIAQARKVYNTSVFIDTTGKINATYRKIHLFAANLGTRKIREADRMLAGKKKVIVSVKEFKAGLSICFDLRFSDLYQYYTQKNVDLICVPSAFTYTTGQAHWEILLRARAIESRAYVLAPNQCGQDDKGLRHYGHSMIVDPWGKILARASEDKSEIIYADVDKKVISQYHQILPVYQKGN